MCLRELQCIFMCMNVGESGKREREEKEREGYWENVRKDKSSLSKEGHGGLSQHPCSSVWPQFL